MGSTTNQGTSGGGGNDFPEIEWPQIQADNNAIWMDSPTQPYFYWNNETNQFTTFGKNVINSNWGTGVMSGGDGTGWASWTSVYAFPGRQQQRRCRGCFKFDRSFTKALRRNHLCAKPGTDQRRREPARIRAEAAGAFPIRTVSDSNGPHAAAYPSTPILHLYSRLLN